MKRKRTSARRATRRLALEALESRTLFSAVPVLHSLPSAANTLYLDFDSHFELQWSDRVNVGVTPFDLDGRVWELSSSEVDAITEVWRIVAEDFAPFNIDVTTELPGNTPAGGKFLRAAIGGEVAWVNGKIVASDNRGNAGDWARRRDGSGNTMGGISLTPSYDRSEPSWVFPAEVGFNRIKIGNTISHEAGHGFGLAHQVASGTQYNPGGSDWTPIMGDNTQTDRHFWFVGQGENGSQDDLDSLYSVLGRRPDDHLTGSQASPMSRNGTTLSVRGVIGQRSDQDWFWFDTGGDTVNLTVVTGSSEVSYAADPARHGSKLNVSNGNLDAIVTLSSESGQVFTRYDPPNALGASISVNVPAGRYYVRVESNRAFDGNLGLYSIFGNAPAMATPTTPGSFRVTALSPTDAEVTWSDVPEERGYRVFTWRGGREVLLVTLPANVTSYSATGLTPGQRYWYRVEAFNVTGSTSTAWQAATTPVGSTALPVNSDVSLRSFNYPDYRLRHRSGAAFIAANDGSNLYRLDSTFTVRAGLGNPGGVSFESVNYPGYFLRHRNYRLVLERHDGSDLFRQDATFHVRQGLANASGVSFESLNYPGHYLRHRNYQIWLDVNDGSNLFKADATFFPV